MTAMGRKPHLSTLIALSALAVLSLNVFMPSLGGIAEDFGVSFTFAAMSVSGFLLVSAVVQVVMGPMSDRYGRRPVLLTGLAMFTLASLGCALAMDIWTFLLFRLGQGGIVAGVVLSRAVVRDVYTPQDAAKRIAQIGAVMALAPLLGPALGGVLDSLFGWRSVFVLLAMSGAVAFVLCWFDLTETNVSPQANFMAQFRAYPRLLNSGVFWCYSGVLIFSLGGFYAYVAGAALVGAETFGLSTTMVGVLMGATAIGFMIGNLINTQLMARMDILPIILLGRWVSLLGCLGAALVLAMGIMHPAILCVGAIFLGGGNGLTVPGANVGVMNVTPQLAGSAAGLSGALIVMAGALLTPLVSTVVAGPNAAVILMLAMATCSALALMSALILSRLTPQTC